LESAAKLFVRLHSDIHKWPSGKLFSGTVCSFNKSAELRSLLTTHKRFYVSGKTIMSVPFIDLKRFEPGFHDILMEKFHLMTSESQFIGGQEVHNLEHRLQSELGVGNAVSCANGTDAMQLALRAVGVGENDVVLVPNVTFWATFEAVVNVGARPVTI
jgi:hypothetical protein